MRLQLAHIVMPLGLSIAVSLVSALAGCATSASSASEDEGSASQSNGGPSVSSVAPLANAFATSSAKSGVPRDLLVAIAKVEDGLSLPRERANLNIDNEVPAAGPLQLRRGKLNTLRRGAELVGSSELDLRRDSDLALEAGALVLREIGPLPSNNNDEHHASDPNDLASWSHAVEEMSGYADDANRAHYKHQVYATLARGGTFVGRDGEKITLTPHHELPPSLTIDVSANTVHPLAATAQYPGAQWIPTSCTNKCTPGRAGNTVQYVVIHDTEGGWNASVATLQNDPDKSVQYIVGEDGKVAQFVTEETTAWHAGNFNYNQKSIGIEHVGYATKPFPEAEYVASAKLVDHLLTKYNIPRDRAHVIGHDQIPNGNAIGQTAAACSASPKSCESNTSYGGAGHHTDPGIWEWATFMPRLNAGAKCNDVTNLWNCSNDKKKAFRCANNKVEVATCGGACVVKPNGVDDVCNALTMASTPADGEEPGSAEKSSFPSSEGEEGSEAKPGDTQAGFLPTADERKAQGDDGGCSIGRVRSASTRTNVFGLGGLGIAIPFFAIRRRVRRDCLTCESA